LVTYEGIEYNYQAEIKNVNDVIISKSMLHKILEGSIFEVEDAKIYDGIVFTDFAKLLTNLIPVPIYEDSLIVDIKDQISFIKGPFYQLESYIDRSKEESDELNKTFKFITELDEDTDLKKTIESILTNSNNLYYDIYDVDGFLSILTDDHGFDFYIDVGDMSNNFNPTNTTPFCVFLSHFHLDHYNILLTKKINPNYYILPYSSSVSFKGKHYYSANQIQLIITNTSKVNLLLTGTPKPKGKRNSFCKYSLFNYIDLFLPLYLYPNNRNMESIALEFVNLNTNVFYPGDTKNYMYYQHLKNFDYFIASHHGGDVGKLDLAKTNQKNILINTYTSNSTSSAYKNNLSYYQSKTANLKVFKQNDGKKGLRIKLK
jgi:hypothetical protein